MTHSYKAMEHNNIGNNIAIATVARALTCTVEKLAIC